MKRRFKTLAEAEREFNAAIEDRDLWKARFEANEMLLKMTKTELAWTKGLVTCLAEAIQAGSREGTFPRRNA